MWEYGQVIVQEVVQTYLKACVIADFDPYKAGVCKRLEDPAV